MTSDMSGAACVVATVVAAAALQLPMTVIAYAPLAENLPSGSSYRPGDVLTHFGGKTVHVLNTDAEGRLVLADAIVRATQDDPDYLIEMSTLTGAQLVALGKRTMGVMGTEAFRDRVAEIARSVGEGGWAMPLPEELREGLDSPLADLANVANDRAGGMLVAGHYLKEFIPDGLTWAHLDIAGPAFNTGKPYGYTASGGTGVPVRTLLAVLEEIAAGLTGPAGCRTEASIAERISPAVAALLEGLPAGVVAHPLRIADDGRVVDRERVLAGELLGLLRRADGRRVNSPSWATSSIVGAASVVLGSVKTSMPCRAGHPPGEMIGRFPFHVARLGAESPPSLPPEPRHRRTPSPVPAVLCPVSLIERTRGAVRARPCGAGTGARPRRDGAGKSAKMVVGVGGLEPPTRSARRGFPEFTRSFTSDD